MDERVRVVCYAVGGQARGSAAEQYDVVVCLMLSLRCKVPAGGAYRGRDVYAQGHGDQSRLGFRPRGPALSKRRAALSRIITGPMNGAS